MPQRQATLCQMGLERRGAGAGFDGDGERGPVEVEHPAHALHIERHDAAMRAAQRRQPADYAGAASKRDDGQ